MHARRLRAGVAELSPAARGFHLAVIARWEKIGSITIPPF
jgi:hypothetical protein